MVDREDLLDQLSLLEKASFNFDNRLTNAALLVMINEMYEQVVLLTQYLTEDIDEELN